MTYLLIHQGPGFGIAVLIAVPLVLLITLFGSRRENREKTKERYLQKTSIDHLEE